MAAWRDLCTWTRINSQEGALVAVERIPIMESDLRSNSDAETNEQCLWARHSLTIRLDSLSSKTEYAKSDF